MAYFIRSCVECLCTNRTPNLSFTTKKCTAPKTNNNELTHHFTFLMPENFSCRFFHRKYEPKTTKKNTNFKIPNKNNNNNHVILAVFVLRLATTCFARMKNAQTRQLIDKWIIKNKVTTFVVAYRNVATQFRSTD